MSYEDYRGAFEWQLPDRYNIATASLDRRSERRTATALYHVDESGMHHEFTFDRLTTVSHYRHLPGGEFKNIGS